MGSAPERPGLPPVLLRGVRLLDAARRLDAVGDVLVRGRCLAEVAPGGLQDAPPEDALIIDAPGAWLLPGTLDLWARLGLPSAAGGRGRLGANLAAAARGGLTAVAPRPDTHPPNDAPPITRLLRSEAAAEGGIRLHPVGALTAGVAGTALAAAAALHAEGVVALSDGNQTVLDAGLFRRALEYARTFGLPVLHRGEDPGLAAGTVAHEGPTASRLGLRASPGAAEAVVVARDLELAELTGTALILGPLSAGASVRLLRAAKARGLEVGALVTVDHLLQTDRAIEGYDVAAKRVPPFRGEDDRQALLEGVRDGTIDAVVSGHDPPRPGRAEAPFADAEGGAATLDLALPRLIGAAASLGLSPLRTAALWTTGPADLLQGRLPARPGLVPGAPADLTLVGPPTGDAEDARPGVAPEEPETHGDGTGRNLPPVRLTMVDGRPVHLDPTLASRLVPFHRPATPSR